MSALRFRIGQSRLSCLTALTSPSFRIASRCGLSFSKRNIFTQSRRFLPAFNTSSRTLFPSDRKNQRFFSTEDEHTRISRLRNIAIIAHVDHGKTTLVDGLLTQSSAIATDSQDRVMDSNDLERERGITILSKCTSLIWQDPNGKDPIPYQMNIVDTPGHADFGGEVERILSMVDGVCLVVDATEGPMTQTKFVLAKALSMGLHPIVVLNKADRDTHRIGEVENEIFDTFLNLGATDEQMDFPVIYASAKQGWAVPDPKNGPKENMHALFNLIVEHVPPPQVTEDAQFSMIVSQIDRHSFFGKCMQGRIQSGRVEVGDTLTSVGPDGEKQETAKVVKVLHRKGLEHCELPYARAGDIVALAGFRKASVRSTLCDPSALKVIPSTPIDPPTLSMVFSINKSPFAGKEGSKVTAASILDRLTRECDENVSLQFIHETSSTESFEIRGRGEMQLAVLIETMRREDFELSVSCPQVVYKHEDDEVMEPQERVEIDCLMEHTAGVIEKMSYRKGEMLDFISQDNGRAKLIFEIPTRGLIGYRVEFQNDTSGSGVLNNMFDKYVPHRGEIQRSQKGAIVSLEEGKITPYAIAAIEPRGTLFVGPGEQVYAGMVIGEASKPGNLDVNPVKEKALNNIRTKSSEGVLKLTPPRVMQLEQLIAYVKDDEIIEITPRSIRLRKVELDANKRQKTEKQAKQRRQAAKGL